MFNLQKEQLKHKNLQKEQLKHKNLPTPNHLNIQTKINN